MTSTHGDWPPRTSAFDHPEGLQQRGSTGQLFEVREGRWVRIDGEEPKKRRTVNVRYIGHGNGITLRRYKRSDSPFMPSVLPIGEPVELRAGSNPGIDKEFFEAWIEENASLAAVLSAEDEDEPQADPQRAAEPEEEDHGS